MDGWTRIWLETKERVIASFERPAGRIDITNYQSDVITQFGNHLYPRGQFYHLLVQ